MILRLLREPTTENAVTFGVLRVNGVFSCWTLEDAIRAEKIMHQTCIPAGKYEIMVRYSPRFQRDLPVLLNVPGFEGILIHPGNTAEDTSGCILPGTSRGVSAVGGSRVAFERLFSSILSAKLANERVWIHVENPETDEVR